MLHNLLVFFGFRRKFKVGDVVAIGMYETWEKKDRTTILEVGKTAYRAKRHIEYEGKDLSYEITLLFDLEVCYEKV